MTRCSCLIQTRGNKVTTGRKTDGLGRPMVPAWQCMVSTSAHIWKCLAHQVPRLHFVSFSYGKTPYDHENPNAKYSPQGKIPTFGRSQFTTHHYINTRPPLSAGTQKIPSSLTIEFLEISHSLTWPLEGFWPVPRQCLLFSPSVLVPQVPTGAFWSLQLIDDFDISSA